MAWRKWLAEVGHGGPWSPPQVLSALPRRPHHRDILDRFEQHTKSCASCSKVHPGARVPPQLLLIIIIIIIFFISLIIAIIVIWMWTPSFMESVSEGMHSLQEAVVRDRVAEASEQADLL